MRSRTASRKWRGKDAGEDLQVLTAQVRKLVVRSFICESDGETWKVEGAGNEVCEVAREVLSNASLLSSLRVKVSYYKTSGWACALTIWWIKLPRFPEVHGRLEARRSVPGTVWAKTLAGEVLDEILR